MSTTIVRARRFRVLALVAALIAISVPAPAAAVTTSSVRDWNMRAAQALFNAPAASPAGIAQPPTVGVIHLAMVQGAVYDAVNAIDGSRQPYLRGLPAAPSWASIDAAVAVAAHDVLVGIQRRSATGAAEPLLPAGIRSRLLGDRDASLGAIAPGAAKDAGIAIGSAAAAAMLSNRALGTDGRYASFSFDTDETAPGQWRPLASGSDPNAWVAVVRPFTIERPSQFRSEGPLALTSKAYAEEYNEVKALGSASSTVRTTEQTNLARFYTASPPPTYNLSFRTLAADSGLSLAEEARLFAMLNMSGADSLISCWDDKARWNFWRPETAIRRGDTDGNRATAPDPGWTSLVGSPPYPDHPSGYNCITSGFMHTAQDFFGGDKTNLSITSSGTGTAVTREYSRFSAVWKDTIDARMYLGIHFRTPNVQAVVMGKKVAHWLNKHYFGPAN